MADLVLHIGAHKTGTSYIQRRLFRNRDQLAQKGIFYPDIGPNPAHHVLTAKWIPNAAFDASLSQTGGIEALWNQVISDHAERDGTLFLSGEPFSRLAPQQVDFAELATMLSRFSSVRIIYVARHQVELIQSIWQEVLKSGHLPNLRAFLKHAIEAGLASGVPVDHAMMLDHLAKGFSKDQITVLDYQTARQHSGGILQALMDAAGLLPDTRDLAEPVENTINSAPPALTQWIATKITAPRPANPKILEAIDALLVTRHGQKKSTIFTPSQIAAIRKGFAERNETFVARVQETQPDFKLTADGFATENLITPKQLDTRFGLDLCEAIIRL